MYRRIFIPEDTKDLEEWFERLGEEFFHTIDVKQGQTILDVGCGVGTYSLPAAKTVGNNGKVYAIDNDKECINELKKRIEKENLSSIIVPILTDGSFVFPIENESVDNTLLCDVIGVILHHTKDVNSIDKLMKELHRITISSGKITIIFKHINHWQRQKSKVDSIINKYFSLEKEFSIPHIHWNFKEIDPVCIFTKR